MRKIAPLLLTAFLLLTSHPARTQKTGDAHRPLPRDAERWVHNTLRRMTLDEKIGQLVMVSYFGGFTSAQSPEYREMLRQISQNHVGGFIVVTRAAPPAGFERSQAYATAVLANQLQRQAKVPLLLAADFERGTAMRLVDGTSFPYPMHVAATGRTEDAYTMGRITALEARAVGIHCVFAPVADVNINPDNPIINTRSFGEDPQRVSELVAAYVRGVEENGALATAKHFPGHGDTNVDSHVDLPTIRADKSRLESVELAPFRAAISAGAGTIMTGHLAVPAVEPDPDVPATLSPLLLTNLLRKEMGFEGLIFTDAMDMGGVSARYTPGEAAVRAILAGSDMLLLPPIPDAAIFALKEAVLSGRISLERIDDSAERVLRAKARLGLHRQRQVDVDGLNQVFGLPEFTRDADDISNRGMTLLRDDAKLLPLDAAKPMRVLLAIISGDPDTMPGAELEREIRWRADRVEVLRVDTRYSKVDQAKLPPPANYDVAIVAPFVRVADRKNTVGLPPEQVDFVNRILATGKPVIVASFGSPYLIATFPQARTWLAAFSTFDVVQRAAARALFGQVAISGRIPVSVPGAAKAGEGLSVSANPMTLRPAPEESAQRLKPVFELLERGVADRAFPGGVLAVGYRGEVTTHPFGRHTYDSHSPEVTAATVYDVDSLTQPVVTSTAIALLMTANRVPLDALVFRFVPEIAQGPQLEWRKKITVRQLLTHTSGLPASADYFRDANGKRGILKKIYAESLTVEPGTRYEYSRLGLILLGEIVERVTGKSLDPLARERIFDPLGLKDSVFNPSRALLPRIAPTEDDFLFRKRLLLGEAMDANTFAMGGVSGAAGLFSTAADLAVVGQLWLNGGIYAHQRILSRRVIEQWTAPQNVPGAARSLAWAMLSPEQIAATGFSEKAFGETAATGTSIWMDPAKELFIVLLTNRTHPSAQNKKLDELLPGIHAAVLTALELKK